MRTREQAAPGETRGVYQLRAPANAEDWQQYHDIRRTVLWEARGRYGSYDANHPDDRQAGNHPLLLFCENVPVGVIRVDVDGRTAIFRRVAIRQDGQRRGHGRVLIALAERFAASRGCDHLYSFVNPDAVGFYVKCGFGGDPDGRSDGHHVPMQKFLR